MLESGGSRKLESMRIDMKFLREKPDTISERVFVMLKYILSVFSVMITSAFVLVLETRI
jgi:hypothetical protein